MKYVYASYKVTLRPAPQEYFYDRIGGYAQKLIVRYPFKVDCINSDTGQRQCTNATGTGKHDIIRGKTFFSIGQGTIQIGNSYHGDSCIIQPDPQTFVRGQTICECQDIRGIRQKIHIVDSFFYFKHVFFMQASRMYIRVRTKRIDLAKSYANDYEYVTQDDYGSYIGNTPIIDDSDYDHAACEFFANDYMRYLDDKTQCHIAIRKRSPNHVHFHSTDRSAKQGNLKYIRSQLSPFTDNKYYYYRRAPTGPLTQIVVPDPWPEDADEHTLETQENLYVGHIVVRFAYDYEESTILDYTKEVNVGDQFEFTLTNDKAAGVRHIARISILDDDGGVTGQPIVIDIPQGVTGTTIQIPQIIGESIGNSTVCSAQFDLQTIGCVGEFLDESLGHSTVVFNLTVPQNIVPTINNFAVIPTAPASILDWDGYVQGVSKVKVSVNVTPAPGTSITRYIFSGGCSAIEQTSATSIKIENLDVNRFGQAVFAVRVYDSRGRYSESTQTINVYPYSPPRIKRASVQRWNITGGTHDEESTSVRITADKQYSPCGNKNSVTLSYRIETEEGELVKGGQITNANAFYVQNPPLEVDKTYRVIFTAQDLFRTVTKELYINSNTYTIYFKPNGNVVSFGKMADTSKYNCVELDQNWTIMRGDEDILDKIDSLQHRLSNLGV